MADVLAQQVITESMGEKYLAMKLKDQERAIAMLADDPQLSGLRQARVCCRWTEGCLDLGRSPQWSPLCSRMILAIQHMILHFTQT